MTENQSQGSSLRSNLSGCWDAGRSAETASTLSSKDHNFNSSLHQAVEHLSSKSSSVQSFTCPNPFHTPSSAIQSEREAEDEHSSQDGASLEVGRKTEVSRDSLSLQSEPKMKTGRKAAAKSSIGKRKSSRLPPKTAFCNKTKEAQIMKQLSVILKKSGDELCSAELELLQSFPTLVHVLKKRCASRVLASERLKEFEESGDVLEQKCSQLAEVIRSAKSLVVYSGAGISTSAQIPDYRGPNGIWTRLRNGHSVHSQNPTLLTTADPTLTHMAIKQLYTQGIVKHVLSQNIDGLHLRSGIPKNALSEVHGNMYVEVCVKCGREYVRLFDVTEKTRRYGHQTGRRCYHCGTSLRDTVVHFGERGSLRWPLNWAGAEYNAHRADVILCIGSSLKVLRRYPWLWCMDQPASKRPRLIIVNLQWTPKDQFSDLKIHGRCDEVMECLMRKLGFSIPAYSRPLDPIFGLATPLHHSELRSKSSRENFYPALSLPPRIIDLNNYIQFEPTFLVPTSAHQDAAPLLSAAVDKRKNGWLENAWGAKPKGKQRKLK